MAAFYRVILPIVLLSLTACVSRQKFVSQPIPPPEIADEQPRIRYSFDHKLDPDPNYEPADIDAFAAKLSGITKPQPAPSVQPPPLSAYARVPQSPYAAAAPDPLQVHVHHHHDYSHHDYSRHDYNTRRHTRMPLRDVRYREPGRRYINTLFWGGAGAIIGHQRGHAGEGALIGATFGRTIDRGGLHGLLSPSTIIGAAAGAAASRKPAKGALIGAGVGFLLDDVFR